MPEVYRKIVIAIAKNCFRIYIGKTSLNKIFVTLGSGKGFGYGYSLSGDSVLLTFHGLTMQVIVLRGIL